jgi:hypothetical protein
MQFSFEGQGILTFFGENETLLVLDAPKYGMIRDWSGRDLILSDNSYQQLPLDLNTLMFISGIKDGFFEISMDLMMDTHNKELNKIGFKLDEPIWKDVMCKVLVESNDLIMALSQDHGIIHSGW